MTCSQRGIGKHALLADVHVAHHLPVAPLVVPQHAQRLAHATVLELRPVEVEHEALGHLRFGRAQVGALQAAVVQLRAVVAQRVGGGREFAVVVIAAAFEHLPRHFGIAEVLDAQLVEIVATTADRQIARPPVGVPLEGDAAAVVDAPDTVRPAADRLVEASAVGKIALLPVVFGQYRQAGEVQRQGAPVVGLEVEAHAVRAFHDDGGDIGELGAVLEAALAHQQLEGEAYVLGAHRLAIGECGARVDLETQPGILRATLHAPGDQAVDGVGFIERAHGQWRVQQAIDLADTDAFVDVRQDMVELADLDGRAAQDAAFGGVGVDVVEMLEAGVVAGGFAVDGEGVGGCSLAIEGKTKQKKVTQGLWERVHPRKRQIRQRRCVNGRIRG